MGKEVVSPLVSIICNTYNHVNYIRQCLDGFLMQETNFPIEILVHDDASTDGTADIVREYEDKYPDLIKPIYQTENQYSKGVKVSLKYQYSRANGKYIALCEGDDYWTDPLKLQKQVDFLEKHLDCVMCSHNYSSLINDDNLLINTESEDNREYNLTSLTKGDWCFHPLTVVFRASAFDMDEYLNYKYSMDAILFYSLLKRGGGYCMSDNMAVYRIHSKGVWSGINRDQKLETEFKARMAIYEVEKSDMAAQFLLTQFTKGSRRIWILKQYKMIARALAILYKHYGLYFVFELMFKKMILNRNYKY